jgi:sialidase-1
VPPTVTHRRRLVLYCHPPDYLGWPSLMRAADGRVACVFSSERDTHVCPYGKIGLVTSRDVAAETWEDQDYRVLVSTPLDDRDPGLVLTPQGAWLLTWFSLDNGRRLRAYRAYYPDQVDAWGRHLGKIPQATRALWADHWCQRSTDQGQTWSAPVPTRVSAPHGPFACPDGRLIYVGSVGSGTAYALEAMMSPDDGVTWRPHGAIDYEAPRGETTSQLNEAHGVALDDQTLVAWWRQEYDRHTSLKPRLHACRSEDGGRTWSRPEPTPVRGQTPHVLRLLDGRLLLTFGWRLPPYGVRACVLDPEARRWSYQTELVLADDGVSPDLGYPATVELAPGHLLTAYYEADTWNCGTIVGVRWRLEG